MVLMTIALRATTRRVPLIKFRKGGLVMSGADEAQPRQQGIGVVAASSAVSDKTAKAKAAPAAAAKGPVIEDWQLPPRYRRKPFSEEEIDYINRGGPA